ncbi:MAG TPA: asparagine synthase (glutamine-hydrolyzing) [Clostridia bacterium]|nr:asparagine synthase (glutamine-hydrolyzing) [Clostridia bacterium]
MCGIAGIIDWQGVTDQREEALKMQATLRRRGPDQAGLYAEGPASLAHTRLCVVDLEHGKQPMRLTHEGETYILLYNGELYNTGDLRRELRAFGHSFEGHSDTEVLLHAYAQWHENCVARFNGIFAFAVWEPRRRRLFIARDRIGVKPFFYRKEAGRFLFASEIKALLAHPDVRARINGQAVAELMFIGPGRTPGYGVFSGVEELPPAGCGFLDEDGLRCWRYWSLEDREHTDSFERTVETVRALVIDAIERQLVSDVPVGTFLSGGLDSSIISAVADRHFQNVGRQLQTFSVDYRDNGQYFHASKFQPNQDRPYIERMNAFLNAAHRDVILETPELVEALFEAVDARDLPGMADVDASLLLFCKEIKRHVTVALSGECADEIFGGYPWYRDPEIRAREGFPWAQSTKYRAGFVQEAFLRDFPAEEYVNARYQATLADTSILPAALPQERRMREMMRLNLDWFMQTLLDRKDRMSMYSGLEVRVPYCDYRIAEYLYAVPWEMKDYQGKEKGLLRTAMEGLLPEDVLWRKKSPYPKTHHPAYLSAVRERLQDVLADPNAPVLEIVRKDALEALLTTENQTPWYGQLMTTPQTIAYFLQMDYWMRKYRVTVDL